MKGFSPAQWGASPSVIQDSSGKGLFRIVDLKWSEPSVLPKTGKVPRFKIDVPIIYAVIRDHGKKRTVDNIRYVGLSMRPKSRFGDHSAIKNLAEKRGETRFSFSIVNVKGKNKEVRTKETLEQIEHILIWALASTGHDLDNHKKQYTLPGLGKHKGTAWNIRNTGYRFRGRMPREIVFPWMLLKVGRDRSLR